MTTDERIEALSASVNKMAEEIRDYARENEKKGLEDQIEKLKAKEPWWSTLIKFIGLPAAIILLVLNFKQTGNVSTDTELKQTEIEKTKMEILEKRLSILTDSVSVQKIETTEDRIRIKKDVADLSNIINEIKEIKSSNNTNTLISRFIVVYLFFVAIELFMRIFRFLWNNLVVTGYRLLENKWRGRRYESGGDEKMYKKRQRVLEWVLIFTNAIPSIISITLDFLVITAVVIPLFNLTSHDLGSSGSFENIFSSIKHLNFVEAVKKLKGIVF